jgi:hypothetical protein
MLKLSALKLFGALFAVSLAAFAQHTPTKEDLAKPIPRTPEGKPDFSGVWQHPYVPDMSQTRGTDQKGPGELPFNAAGAENFKNYDVSKFDYTGHCLPFGLLRSVNVGGYPIQILQNKTYLAMLFEQNTWFHVVYMDGRPHPKEFTDPTWFGHSIGHYEGDTLVIDTVGFNGLTRLDTAGHPHSAKMHVIQKFTFQGPNYIAYEVTVDDPVYYSKAFTNTRMFWRMEPGEELIEYSCEENNRDFNQGHIK